jgi:hypothetical protein
VKEALHRTGREDLIGYGKHCLLRPDPGTVQPWREQSGKGRGRPDKPQKGGGKPAARRSAKPEAKASANPAPQPRPKKKAGWATAKPQKNARKKR